MHDSDLGRSLLAATGGSLATIAGFSLGMPLELAAVTGGVAFVGLTLLFKKRENPKLIDIPQRTREILVTATERVHSLESTSHLLPAPMYTQVLRIVETARSIIRELQEKPANIEAGQRFLTYYLESTQTVITSYRRLVDRKSGQITTELEANVLGLLSSVAKNFIQQKENMLAADVMRLKTEMEVLQRSMEMDGV